MTIGPLPGTAIFTYLKLFLKTTGPPEKIFFNTRIVRVTETLLYCARLYNQLDIDPATVVNITVRHGGLRDRLLDATGNRGRLLRRHGPSQEDECETEIRCTLDRLESGLVDNVRKLVAPLFTLFDFFDLPDDIYEDIVNDFVNGKIS